MCYRGGAGVNPGLRLGEVVGRDFGPLIWMHSGVKPRATLASTPKPTKQHISISSSKSRSSSMSRKKYQVFLSSTYSDLRSERDSITKALYEMDCIPVGMEAFPAADEEQLSFIKRIIQDTDYYILIVGARYGSLDREGVSFTEREYQFAKSIGIPILAFIHDDPGGLDEKKSDLSDAKKAEQFYRFRNEVMESRMVKMWNEGEPPRFCRRLLSSYFKLRFCLISRLVRISPPLRLV
ncbi:DUF4062 domain-containing protein [Roseovarius rhodophyticola]|uniref:DUF4062 domain-containing protein n=1 Tax=Roseovarius rhodophyticola TaxID=3080827 RepID=UPI003BAEB67A